jgi:hypothetical protein
MDVLCRSDPKPRALRDQTVDVVSAMTLRALWLEFASQLETPGAKNPSFFLRSAEEVLRSWTSFLTLELRAQVLDTTARMVIL